MSKLISSIEKSKVICPYCNGKDEIKIVASVEDCGLDETPNGYLEFICLNCRSWFEVN